MNRTYSSQIIQFTGSSARRRPTEQQVNLMQMHGFRLNTSEKIKDRWVIEYTRIVTRAESVSKGMLDKLGANFKNIVEKDSITQSLRNQTTGISASL